MSLVQGIHVPDRLALLSQRSNHLFGFRNRHPRVVFSLNNQHRYLDLFYTVKRADLLEMRAHRRIALIAIFRAPQIASIILRVLQKGDKATYAHNIYRCFQPVAVVY